MKKMLFSLFLVATIIVSSLFVVSACNKNNLSVFDFKNAYRIGISAGVNYLRDNDNVQTQSVDIINVNSLSRPTAIENDVDALHEYVKMFEGYLADSAQEVVQQPDASTDIGQTFGNYVVDEHSIKMSFSVPSLDGTSEQFTVFYTETLINNAGFVEFDDDDEEEINATLNGVAIVGDEIFTLSGSRKSEIEDDEQECELLLIIRKDADNYIKMEYSTETETFEQEDELKFSIYENGVLVSKTSVEFENENGQKQLKLRFKDTKASKVVYKMKFETKNSTNTINVKYSVNNENGNITVTISENGYKYAYSNGFSETIAK